MNMPQLRFKEFCGEWEVKKLDELADITTGNKDTQNKVDDGKYPFFVRSQTIEKINSFSYDGEAILTSGDGVGVGKNFHYINGKFDYHQRVYCIFNFKNQVLGKYIFFYFSEKFNKRVMRLSAKNSVDSVRRDMITDMSTHIPSLPEQTKIAHFLTAIDEKIAQLTQKGELLARYKKGVMQQIFSQQLRFKDDNGREFPEWEVKMLSDVNIYISDGNYGEQYPKAEELKQSGVPFIRANNINGLSLAWADMKFIDHSLHKMLTSGHLETNDILVTTRGDIGMVAYVNDEFHGANINAQICLLRVIDKSKLNTRYLLQLLSSTYCQKQFKELQTGSALKQLPKKNLMQIEILCPVISEQTKIANFLTAIDDKISHNQTQLNALKRYKQGLLQQLFV